MKAQGALHHYMLYIGFASLVTAGTACAQNMSPLTGKLLPEPAAASKTSTVPAAQPAAASSSTTARPAAAPAQATAAAPGRPPETPAPAGAETRIRVGDVTHALLQAQADGRVAGPRLPMLGATADISWQRYLDSFKHPLPEFFENKVSKNSSN